MLLALTLPAMLNSPAATRSPLVSVDKAPTATGNPAKPVPSADQLAPFQRAMPLQITPPAPVKKPPATRSPFGSVARAWTHVAPMNPDMPVPSADQLVPSQR